MINKLRFINFMPTACWMLFMFIPFFLTINLSAGGPEKFLHLLSLTIATLFILAGDFFCFQKKDPISTPIAYNSHLHNIGSGFCIISILGLIFQLSLLENIPFLETLRGTSELQVQIYREESSKLLNIPAFLKYFFNWCSDLFPILGLACLFISNKKTLFFIFLLLFSTLSLSFGVKQTLVKILMTLPIILFLLRSKPFSKKTKRLAIIISVISFLMCIGSILFDKNSCLNPLSESYVPIQKICDASRGVNRQKPNIIANKLEYLIYRAILVPVEVSSHWYDYYTNQGEKIGLSDIGFFRLLQTKSSETSPSRKIGYYYYHQVKPENYLDTVSANASFDADAYAHFGVWGVLIASTLLLTIRLLLTYLCFNNLLSLILRNLGILVLSITIPQASIQAILIPQGLIIILFLMAFLKYYEPFSTWLIFRRNKATREII